MTRKSTQQELIVFTERKVYLVCCAGLWWCRGESTITILANACVCSWSIMPCQLSSLYNRICEAVTDETWNHGIRLDRSLSITSEFHYNTINAPASLLFTIFCFVFQLKLVPSFLFLICEYLQLHCDVICEHGNYQYQVFDVVFISILRMFTGFRRK